MLMLPGRTLLHYTMLTHITVYFGGFLRTKIGNINDLTIICQTSFTYQSCVIKLRHITEAFLSAGLTQWCLLQSVHVSIHMSMRYLSSPWSNWTASMKPSFLPLAGNNCYSFKPKTSLVPPVRQWLPACIICLAICRQDLSHLLNH